MALRIGQIIRGVKWNYLLVEALGNGAALSDVFKAEMIPGAESRLPGKWAAIKTSFKPKVLNMLKHEHSRHINPVIRSSQHIRAMYEAINTESSSTTETPYCLAFEWMDVTLKDVSPETHGHNSVLHKNISKAVLGALAELQSQNLVHTDIKEDNILISDLDGPSPIVKLGDLGAAHPEGFNEFPLQPIAMRAPEVWSGMGCFHCSDVWAFAVTLFDWIRPKIFGSNEVPLGLWTTPWAMAKLLRLFPGSITVHPTIFDYQSDMKIAKMIEQAGCGDSTDEKCIEIQSFEEELGKLDIPLELSAFLRYIFVVDHERRPTALEVLRSQQFRCLDKAVPHDCLKEVVLLEA